MSWTPVPGKSCIKIVAAAEPRQGSCPHLVRLGRRSVLRLEGSRGLGILGGLAPPALAGPGLEIVLALVELDLPLLLRLHLLEQLCLALQDETLALVQRGLRILENGLLALELGPKRLKRRLLLGRDVHGRRLSRRRDKLLARDQQGLGLRELALVLVHAGLLLLDKPLPLDELQLKLTQRPLKLGDAGVVRRASAAGRGSRGRHDLPDRFPGRRGGLRNRKWRDGNRPVAPQ